MLKNIWKQLELRSSGSEKRTKIDENVYGDSDGPYFKESELNFELLKSNGLVILKLERSFPRQIFVSLNKEIVKIERYGQKTILFVENIFDLPDI